MRVPDKAVRGLFLLCTLIMGLLFTVTVLQARTIQQQKNVIRLLWNDSHSHAASNKPARS